MLDNKEEQTNKVLRILGINPNITMRIWTDNFIELLYHDLEKFMPKMYPFLLTREVDLVVAFITDSYNSKITTNRMRERGLAMDHNKLKFFILRMLDYKEDETMRVMRVMDVHENETMKIWMDSIITPLYHDLHIFIPKFKVFLQPRDVELVVAFITNCYKNNILNKRRRQSGLGATSHNVYII